MSCEYTVPKGGEAAELGMEMMHKERGEEELLPFAVVHFNLWGEVSW